MPLGRDFPSTGHIDFGIGGVDRTETRRIGPELHTELEVGEPLKFVPAGDEHLEAAEMQLRSRTSGSQGTAGEMAVLYRINSLSRVLEQAFRDGGVPYVVARGTAFYQRAEIKDAMSYLRLVVNPNDETALRRIINTPPRGIGKASLDKIEKAAILSQQRLGEALRICSSIDGVSSRAELGREVRGHGRCVAG